MKKKLMVGIDLGTTYCAVSLLDETGATRLIKNFEGKSLTPSVVHIDSDKTTYVGDIAKNLLYAKPEATVSEVKRDIGSDKKYTIHSKEYNPTNISALILKKLKKDAEEAMENQTIDSAVITVPANFSNAQRQETMEAANIAGLNVEHIINEPTAAAIAYTQLSNHKVDGTYVMYDFGGGTFDCTVVDIRDGKVDILASDGVKKLGGIDLDKELHKIVEEKYEGKKILDPKGRLYNLNNAEHDKKTLSGMKEIDIFIGDEMVTVTRLEFEEAISSYIQKSLMCMDNALEEAEKSIEDIMDVILVGGTSRIPKIREEIEDKIGKPPRTHGSPDETVALGAAIYVAQKNKSDLNLNQKAAIAELGIQEITNLYFGTFVLNDYWVTKNVDIIDKGTRIPCEEEQTVYLHPGILERMMPRITESLIQTEEEDEVEVVWSKEFEMPSSAADGDAIDIVYSIDQNQVFHCKFTHRDTGKSIEDTISMTGGRVGSSSEFDVDKFDIE
jgi:molecular chaperone DnaK